MRRILAVLLILVAGLGLILCIGGVIGVWVVNEPATEAVTTTSEMAGSYLALAGGTTTSASSQIEALRTQLDEFAATIENMTPETRAKIADQVTGAVQTRIGPTVAALRTTFTTLRTGVIALNRSLESANRLPGVDVPTLSDELQTADQLLGKISDKLTALTTALADLTVDGSRLEEMVASISTELASVEAMLSQWSSQFATVGAAVATVSAAAPSVIDLSSIIASILLILFGAGQVCLILRGVASFRAQ